MDHLRSTVALFLVIACTGCSGSDDPTATESEDGSGGVTAGSGASSNGGEGADGGGTTSDPDELCGAAASAAECSQVALGPLEDCDDCWHACRWISLHEVALVDGECSFGASTGRCEHVTGGESDVATLNDVCRSYGETYGNVLYEETEGSLSIGLLPEGGVARLGSCRRNDAPDECACVCDPEYPDATCEQLDQAFRSEQPSGVAECPGVPIHRATEVECTENVGQCSTSEDCADNEVCLCAHVGGRAAESTCVPAGCETNDDCAETEVCAISYSGQGDACGPTRLDCQPSHNKCGGVQCDVPEICAYNDASGEFGCVDAGACY